MPLYWYLENISVQNICDALQRRDNFWILKGKETEKEFEDA